MNLRDLRYFVALAEHRHFGRAAQASFVSQPTLSTQIKKLEDELGVALVERTPRKVLLTEVGREIAQRAREVLNEVDQIRAIARRTLDPESGTVRLGIFPTLGPYLLPHVVPQIRAAFPAPGIAAGRGEDRRCAAPAARGPPRRRLCLRCRSTTISCTPNSCSRNPSCSRCREHHALARRKSLKLDDLERPESATAGRRPLPARSGAGSVPACRRAARSPASARPAWKRCARWWRRMSASPCCLRSQ